MYGKAMWVFCNAVGYWINWLKGDIDMCESTFKVNLLGIIMNCHTRKVY